MILITASENGTLHECLLSGARHSMQILDGTAVFYRTAGGYSVRLSHTLKCEERITVKDGSYAKILSSTMPGECAVCVCTQAEGIDRYVSFIRAEEITIGSSEQDDIQVTDARINPGQIVIRNDRMTDMGAQAVLFCNGIRVKECTLTTGSLVQILNLRMTIGPDFIRVCRCPNIHVHLPAFRHASGARIPELPHRMIFAETPVMTCENRFEAELEEPEEAGRRERSALVFSMGPALMMSSASLMSGFFVMYNGILQGRPASQSMIMIILPGVMLVSTLTWMPLQRFAEKRKETKQLLKRNREYRLYLQELSQQAEHARSQYRDELMRMYPGSSLMREDPVSPSFLWRGGELNVRLGCSNKQYPVIFKRNFRLSRNDEIRYMIDEYEAGANGSTDMPLLLKLVPGLRLRITGEYAQDMLAWILFQASLYYPPDVLRITAKLPGPDGFWVRILPHAVCLDSQQLNLSAQREENGEVFLLQGHGDNPAASCPVRIHTHAGTAFMIKDGKRTEFVPDIMECIDLCSYASKLYALAPAVSDTEEDVSFLRLYHAESAAGLNIAYRWQRRVKDGMAVPVGLRDDGSAIMMDLSERGLGPHGLIAGATGSGKSVFLTTLLLSLAVSFSPAEVGIVLIDFKGGGAVQQFSNSRYRLPHLRGVLSNLEPAEAERALIAIRRVCSEREILFRKMSETVHCPVASLGVYQEQWRKGCGLPYLCELVIVVDEFAELKREYPEFMKELISLSRIGRSLGIHLILATQKPSGIVDDQIWSNARFKVCLKVQERQDSMEMIHSPAAASLRRPGAFWLLHDDQLEHGMCGYAGAAAGRHSITVRQYDEENKLLKERTAVQAHAVSELEETIHEILQTAGKENSAYPEIWTAPLRTALRSSTDPPYTIGRADDFRNGRITGVCLPHNLQGSAVFLSPDREEKISILNTLMYALLKDMEAQDEIILLDGIGYKPAVSDDSRISGIIRSHEIHRRIFALKHIRARTPDSAGRVCLIVDDYAAFAQDDPGFAKDMREIMESSGIYACETIVFCSFVSALPYRMLAAAGMRICLKNSSIQEMSAFLETAVRRPISDHLAGLTVMGDAVACRFFSTAEDMLKSVRICMDAPHFRIPEPVFPLHIRDRAEEGLRIGLRTSSFTWLYYGKETVIFLGEDADALHPLKELWCRHADTVWMPGKHELKELFHGSNVRMIFMLVHEFETAHLRQSVSVIWTGPGIHNQMVLRWRGEDPGDGEGILFAHGRGEVIFLAGAE